MKTPQFAYQGVPMRPNLVSADNLTITAGNSGVFYWGGTEATAGNRKTIPSRVYMHNNTGGTVYFKVNSATAARDTSSDVYDAVTPEAQTVAFHDFLNDGESVMLDQSITQLAVFVPAAGPTLNYKSASANFVVLGWDMRRG